MQLRHKAGFRDGLSVEESRRQLVRDRINAMTSHAKWAGERVAIQLRERGCEELVHSKVYMTRILGIYQIQEPLIEFATRVAKREIDHPTKKKIFPTPTHWPFGRTCQNKVTS